VVTGDFVQPGGTEKKEEEAEGSDEEVRPKNW
jgi:hypothetical protein